MNIIDTIRLSGTDYTLSATSSGGTEAVEVTQAEYDALVSGGTVDPTVFYIITDAQPVDISNYWTSAQTNSAINAAVSGKVDTSTITSSVTSASTNSEIPTAKAVYDAVGSGSGGKAVSAGTNISITTGETADTINCTVPYVGDPYHRITYGYAATTNKSQYSLVIGGRCNTTSDTQNNIVVGYDCHSRESHNAVFGVGNYSNNRGELSSGFYNVSNSGSTDADKTLFSVGNGTANNARHNAFEVRQNGDIYLSSGGTDIKLQDHLGGSSITVDTALDSGSTNPVENRVIYNKIDEVEQVTARALNELNEKINALIEANEVVARALNDLNDRITALENA